MDKEKKIGQKISPILNEIESALIDFKIFTDSCLKRKIPIDPLPNFDDIALRSAIYILNSIVLEKIWQLQENEKMDFEDRMNMAFKFGSELKKLIKIYTGIDTFELFKEIIQNDN